MGKEGAADIYGTCKEICIKAQGIVIVVFRSPQAVMLKCIQKTVEVLLQVDDSSRFASPLHHDAAACCSAACRLVQRAQGNSALWHRCGLNGVWLS
jgi:hypothetical protein